MLHALMGQEVAAPKTDGSEAEKSRSCTWLAPSTDEPMASLIIRVTRESPPADLDKEARRAYMQDVYRKHTPEGDSCESFDGAGYQACWLLFRKTLMTTILKDDYLVYTVMTLPKYRETGREGLLSDSRVLSGHVVSKL